VQNATHNQKGLMHRKGALHKGKGSTEVNFKHGVGEKLARSARELTYLDES